MQFCGNHLAMNGDGGECWNIGFLVLSFFFFLLSIQLTGWVDGTELVRKEK
jgi:hypothetical protein